MYDRLHFLCGAIAVAVLWATADVKAQLSETSGIYLQLSDLEPDASELDANSEALPDPIQSQLVEQGKLLFNAACLDCHEAEQALDKRKTFEAWMSTIAEMAKQEDANIPASSFIPIATYLSALGPPDTSQNEAAIARRAAGKEGTDKSPGKEGDSSGESEKPKFAPQTVARGQAAFQSACTQCHDADRSLSKQKTLSSWLATVRRMARMDGANISDSDMTPIATYLASLSAANASDGPAAQTGQDDAASTTLGLANPLSVSGTVSTLWRGGNDNLENPNFFADAWVRLDWQPEGPLRARVTTCTSCHSDQTSGGGFTLELVEAVASFDLLYGIRGHDPHPDPCKAKADLELRAGRLVVPFGAYHAMSHPGVYRTVTNPLMYNMGRQVNANGARPPVLPMPYSDEGVDLHAEVPLLREWKLTLDGFGVNGLQGGGSGVNFTRSRSYADNNQYVGYGGRATVGNTNLRLGSSVMAGRLEDEGAGPLNYHLAGGDATVRLLDDNLRVYFEYALRRNDSVFGQRQIAYGIVSEVEAILFKKPNLSALLRYDTLEHRDFFGSSSIERYTWGLGTTIAGSTLLVNHEHWNFLTDDTPDVDVFGVRWVAAF